MLYVEFIVTSSGEGGPGSGAPGRETGPPLFAPISNDTAADGRNAWTLCTSTSIFPEFQVVSIRSNNWTGSTCICTMKLVQLLSLEQLKEYLIMIIYFLV